MKPPALPKGFFYKHGFLIKYLLPVLFILAAGTLVYYSDLATKLQSKVTTLSNSEAKLQTQLASSKKELDVLTNEDQYVVNKKLQEEIQNIQSTYKKAVVTYENLLKLKEVSKKTDELDIQLTKSLALLSERNYASASAILANLNKTIQDEQGKIAAAFVIPENVPTANAPPSSGFRRQSVKIDIGTYLVDIVSIDLNSSRAVVDTASDGNCSNDCPVLSLGDYVSRNGAFAGINGSYFCPASYPSCEGKTNSFDTLLMNKNKVYFNSDNNKFSTVPLVAFYGNEVRFVSQSVDWGRDTGVDAVLANQPLTLLGGNVVFGGDDDPKKGSKGSRSFVASSGNTAYIGVVHNATVAEVGHVLKALGIENGLNLDSGGSVALWYSGYKAGPGRNIPNALLFVSK